MTCHLRGEERLRVPLDDDHRLGHDRERTGPRRPQHPLVVLGVAARDVLVGGADRRRGRPTAGPSRCRSWPPSARSSSRSENVTSDRVERPVDRLAVHLDPDPGDHNVYLEVELASSLVLERGLLREPDVVVVTERHERRAIARSTPALRPPGRPGRVVVAGHPDRPVAVVHLEGGVRDRSGRRPRRSRSTPGKVWSADRRREPGGAAPGGRACRSTTEMSGSMMRILSQCPVGRVPHLSVYCWLSRSETVILPFQGVQQTKGALGTEATPMTFGPISEATPPATPQRGAGMRAEET